MARLPSAGGLRSLDVLNADDMEPEDMKCRRLAALKEFGKRNPKYEELIKVHLKLEQRGATKRKQASPWQLPRNGQVKHTAETVPRYTKKSPWTTKSSLELLDAVKRFQKSDSRDIGKKKWKIIAADLMQQPEGFPATMSLTELADYCRIRYANMLSRRHIVDGEMYALPDELKEKLEEFSRRTGKTSPLSGAHGEPSRKNCHTTTVRKKNRMVRLAITKSNSSE